MTRQIEHIVIIVKENHTFDNYFGSLPGANGATLDSAPNPPPYDPDHKHQTWMVRENNSSYRVQYTEHDIPAYFRYTRNFTICDNYFSEVAGPSTPNHLMLICADAPIINNPRDHYRPRPNERYDLKSLPLALERNELSWGNYGGYAFHYISELSGHPGNHSRDVFHEDASQGHLPNVSWVYGDKGSGPGEQDLSEHPKQNVTAGCDWTAQQIEAVVAGGLWDRTAIFVTWDDWGGWFDHVVPPVKEQWDSSMAQRPADKYPEFNGDPFRFGSRVPCLVISPFAKQGYISHQENSHVSLLRFCEINFSLPPFNGRDGGSNGMSDCFDFSQRPLTAPRRVGR